MMTSSSTAAISDAEDAFSTPPSTPTLAQKSPLLSRKNSPPLNLLLSPFTMEDVVLAPDAIDAENGSCMTNNEQQDPTPRLSRMQANKSPCFVHSHLDKGAFLNDWLRSHPPPSQHRPFADGRSTARQTDLHLAHDDDDEYSGSLTTQLAETAVGVREMSKQLGRVRVHSHIQSVLIVTKARDNRLIQLTRDLALYLMIKRRHGGRGLVVYVDNQLRTSRRFDAQGIQRDHPELFISLPPRRNSSGSNLSSTSSNGSSADEGNNHHLTDEGQLRYWTTEMCSQSPHLFDFVVTLGGDGTVLFTSWLFQRIVPPVLPFALGSLGFLTNFDFCDHESVMDSAIESGIRVNLRMRFTCTVYRTVVPEQGKQRKAVKKANTGEILMKNLERNGWEALEGRWSHVSPSEKQGKDKEIMCFSTRPVESFEILNDLVVDRGPSPYVSLLELFGDEHHLTTVQADGLTISTPTGSTAYSLSAGGSLVHPQIPAILITPICPHTLSFRPMLLPDSMELRICVPFNSRSTAWASFDGRGRVELKQGDYIKVTASKYPFPTVCADKQSTDWFHSISRTLKWNERERQKSFVMVEEEPAIKMKTKPRRKRSRSATPGAGVKSEMQRNGEIGDDQEDDEEEEEEEEEDKFDIDDLSSDTAQAKPVEESVKDIVQARAEVAADALSRGNPFISRTPFSKSGIDSGVDSPDRFMDPQPHPPKLSPRHVSFAPTPPQLPSDMLSTIGESRKHDTDHVTFSGSRGKILKGTCEDDTKTTTALVDQERPGQPHARHHHHRGRSREGHPVGHEWGTSPRAFAMWGRDESDSNTSDSEP